MWKRPSPRDAERSRFVRREDEPAFIRPFHQYSLLGLVASGYAAVLGSGRLDVPTALLMLAALGFRAWRVARPPLPAVPARYPRALAILYLGFYPLDYVWISREFVPATVHLVFFIAAILLTTGRTVRELFFLKVIAFLELLAASILSSSLNFFFFLTAFLGFAVATFAGAEIGRSARGRRVVEPSGRRLGLRLSLICACTVAGVLVLTAGLFFVLPRTARAALDRLAPYGVRVAGYANEVTLGAVGEIERRGTPVLHLKVVDGRRPANLRLRGGALAEFDGIRWYNSSRLAEIRRPQAGLLKIAGDDWLRRRARPRFDYQVMQAAAAGDSLFLAGTPEYLRVPGGPVWQVPTGGFRLPGFSLDGLRYAVYAAALPESTGLPPAIPALPAGERNFYLRLPPVDPRVIALTRSVISGARSDETRANLLSDYLRRNYSYSLQALRQEVADPLAYFLIEGRQGHCEYFASALAVMLRLEWIPSRVATGFLGGEENPLTNWTVVRASHAHSWVEAWIPGRGWIVLDPTPPSTDPAASSLWSRAGMYLDAAQTFWQEWVLGYDLDRQWTLAFRMEQSRRGWDFRWLSRLTEGFTSAVGAVSSQTRRHAPLVIVILAVLAVLPWTSRRAYRAAQDLVQRERLRRGQASASDASVLYERLLELLRRRGWDKAPFLTPGEFAASLPAGLTRDRVSDFTRAYNDLRFGAHAAQAARLTLLLDEIEKEPA
jgi:transglutaminase-like putative cysteine protease